MPSPSQSLPKQIFTVIHLPKKAAFEQSPLFPTILEKYRTLRLLALKTSEQFWSSHETERKFTTDQWTKKLMKSGLQVFVCIVLQDTICSDSEPESESEGMGSLLTDRQRKAERGLEISEEVDGEEWRNKATPSPVSTSTSSSASTKCKSKLEVESKNIHPEILSKLALLSTKPFVGILSLQGPIPGEEYAELMDPSAGNDKEPQTTRWQLGSLFTEPSHRQSGVALLLVQAAYRYAWSFTLKTLKLQETLTGDISGHKEVDRQINGVMRIRAMVKAGTSQKFLVGMYKHWWHMKEMTRKANMKEVFVTMGESWQIPSDWQHMEGWTDKGAVVVEDVILVQEGVMSSEVVRKLGIVVKILGKL